MIQQIEKMSDVQKFIADVALEIHDFHPLQDFNDYVYPETYFRRYTEEQAAIRNDLLERCFCVSARHTEDFFTYLLELFQSTMDKLARTGAAEPLLSIE